MDRFRLASLPGAIALTAGYSLVHMTIRLAASGNLGEDDVLDTLYTQTLALGYRPSQPPLYDWLVYSLEHLFGLGLFPFLLLKYLMLVVIAACTFISARIVLKSDVWALLAVESLALIYSLSWRMHEGFTHAMGAMAAAMALLALVLYALDQERPSIRHLCGLGVVTGLGLLTRASFLGFGIALLIAISLQVPLRARTFRWRNLVVLPIALAIPLPYWIWVLASPARIADVRQVLLNNPSHAGLLERLGLAVAQPVGYLFPLIPILPAIFVLANPACWRWWRGDREPLETSTKPDLERPGLERLIRDTSFTGIGLLLLAAVVFPGGEFPIHIIAPMFIATPIWLLGLARRMPGSAKMVQCYVAVALLLAVVALTARLLNLYGQDPFCKICRWGEPYAALADEIKRHGFSDGVIVAPALDLAGNLRRFFPAARVVSSFPFTGRLDTKDVGARAYVIEVTKHGNDPAGDLRKLLPDPKFAASAELIELPWQQLGRPAGTRKSAFQLVILPAQ